MNPPKTMFQLSGVHCKMTLQNFQFEALGRWILNPKSVTQTLHLDLNRRSQQKLKELLESESERVWD